MSTENHELDWDEYLRTRRTNAYTDRDLIKPYLTGKLLEVGCGFGDFADWCKSVGCEVSGIDPSAEAISEAKKQYPSIDFVVAYAEKLPFPDKGFDTVISLEVVEHLKEPELFFAEAFRVLRSNGYLIVQTPNYPIKRGYDFMYYLRGVRKSWADDPTHVSPFSFRKMEKMAESAGFVIKFTTGRNILGEKRFPFLAKMKNNLVGRLLAQKMILVASRP